MVKISKPAREDLRQIYDYIAKDSLFYAREVVNNIIEAIKLIEPFPEKGRIVPELEVDNIRETFIYSYLIHAKKDFENAVKDRIS